LCYRGTASLALSLRVRTGRRDLAKTLRGGGARIEGYCQYLTARKASSTQRLDIEQTLMPRAIVHIPQSSPRLRTLRILLPQICSSVTDICKSPSTHSTFSLLRSASNPGGIFVLINPCNRLSHNGLQCKLTRRLAHHPLQSLNIGVCSINRVILLDEARWTLKCKRPYYCKLHEHCSPEVSMRRWR
jgi:hypothetical protein